MPTATGCQCLADLERDLLAHQRDQFRRLQRAALVKVYTQRTGNAPDSFEVVLAHFEGSFAGPWSITPARHLTPDEVQRILATATGA